MIFFYTYESPSGLITWSYESDSTVNNSFENIWQYSHIPLDNVEMKNMWVFDSETSSWLKVKPGSKILACLLSAYHSMGQKEVQFVIRNVGTSPNSSSSSFDNIKNVEGKKKVILEKDEHVFSNAICPLSRLDAHEIEPETLVVIDSADMEKIFVHGQSLIAFVKSQLKTEHCFLILRCSGLTTPMCVARLF